jgi:hypothetical protein
VQDRCHWQLSGRGAFPRVVALPKDLLKLAVPRVCKLVVAQLMESAPALHVAAIQDNADDVRELTGALRVVVGERRVEIVANGETPDDIGGGLAALKGADEPAVPRCDGPDGCAGGGGVIMTDRVTVNPTKDRA